jgi:hypothetical protein
MKPIVVCGDFRHFKKSALAKASRGRFQVVDAATLEAPIAGALNLAWLPKCRRDMTISPRAMPAGARAVNDTGFDSDKRNVHKHHADIFGYSPAVDPRVHQGPGVVKARANGKHDGKVVRFPLPAAETDRAYERLIDNRVDDTTVCDIRLAVLLGKPVLAYRKYRPAADRFSNTNTRAELVGADAVLDPRELTLCLGFAASIGLEYGEMDILRDRADGRIYIVDANNTPFGPPNHLPETEVERALGLIAEAFACQLR